MDESKQHALAVGFANVINKNSVEGESNTPDFMLGAYLVKCLMAYNATLQERERWSGTVTAKIVAQCVDMNERTIEVPDRLSSRALDDLEKTCPKE